MTPAGRSPLVAIDALVKSWSLVETIISVVGLIGVLLLSLVVQGRRERLVTTRG